MPVEVVLVFVKGFEHCGQFGWVVLLLLLLLMLCCAFFAWVASCARGARGRGGGR